MTFIYGSIEWFIVAGLVTSIGLIIDVYANERESLGKVIVFPFFVIALGFILYGASVYASVIQWCSRFSSNSRRSIKKCSLFHHHRHYFCNYRRHHAILREQEDGRTSQAGNY